MSGEKTEAPTQKRLDDARKRGDVARSRDLVAFVTLGAAYAVTASLGGTMLGRLRGVVVAGIDRLRDPFAHAPAAILRAAAVETATVVAPVLVAMMAAGAATAYLDAGPVFALSRIVPKFERLDPIKGASQLFSRDKFIEIIKSVAVISAVFAVAGVTLFDALTALARTPTAGASASFAMLGELASRLVARSLIVLATLALADVVLSRRQHTRSLRMTKDEVKREYKEADGNPEMKGQRARMHREILEHSVVESVRRADVLVVNPTHLAIALRFDAEGEQDAPEVVAKGEDALAKRMIDAARESGVPVMRDIPLARTLYELDLGDEIPELLFEAVAAVLQAAWDEREAGG